MTCNEWTFYQIMLFYIITTKFSFFTFGTTSIKVDEVPNLKINLKRVPTTRLDLSFCTLTSFSKTL